MKDIDNEIVKVLNKIKGKSIGYKISTYEVAKRVKISWSTAKVHLFELFSKKKIGHDNGEKYNRETDMWYAK